MLADAMTQKLNQQINLEIYSSNLYLQMSAWAAWKGFEGTAAFLRLHADEEMQHAHKLFDYVNETGALAVLGSIEAAPTEFDSLQDMFRKIYEHEVLVTQSINQLAHVAFTTQDYSSFNFLQWYVAEQHEEETLFQGILDKLELVGSNGQGLFLVDREIADLASRVGIDPSPA